MNQQRLAVEFALLTQIKDGVPPAALFIDSEEDPEYGKYLYQLISTIQNDKRIATKSS